MLNNQTQSIVIDILITTGASIVTGAATFLFTRRKYISEVKTNDIENMRRTLQFYVDIVEDNKKRMDLYQNALERVNTKIAMLTDENIELRREVKQLQFENTDLRQKLSNLKQ